MTHANRTAGKTGTKAAVTAASKTAPKSNPKHPKVKPGGLRVRMYRVGFGDFFLVTVPTPQGPRFVLVDCGVHAGDIKTMPECVQDMATLTQGKLALVIVTHYHADHLSGFASQDEVFRQFEVEAVWITNRLDPGQPAAKKFSAQIAALATHLKLQLQLKLAAGEDGRSRQALAMAENALGVSALGAKGSNERALELVTSGFKNKPPVHYYEAGDEPVLPPSLRGVLQARILGPVPKDAAAEFTASDNKAEQYLAAVEERGLPDHGEFMPFDRHWPASAEDYPPEAFKPWPSPQAMEQALQAMQPNALAAAAETIDGTLNNQSLVVLFTCRGKRLLFVGDAQWGNWSYWLYGRAVKGKDPGISDEARDILASLDFYKVGHHGSTNATPIPAVGAMRLRCLAMCCTQVDCYGNPEKKTEVPRVGLMEALERQTGGKLVRSDWIPAGDAPFEKQARQQLEKLPANAVVGKNYIEYVVAE